MGFYDKHVLPRIINCACGAKPIMAQREKVVPLASGTVLEIGIGTGLNLAYYDTNRIDRVIGLDPSETSWKLAARRVAGVKFDVDFIGLPENKIPLESNSVDSVLVTYSLCTIPDPVSALGGIAQVMKPNAKLIFCEHGIAPDAKVCKWQSRLNPLWKKFAGGCHLNRDIPSILESGGFQIESLESKYLEGIPKFANFNYWGTATTN